MKLQCINATLILLIGLSLLACVPPPPAAAPTEPSIVVDSTPSPINAPSATDTSIPTFTPEPTVPTPLPPPLVEIFPQVGGGVEFIFPDNQPDLLSKQFIEAGNCIHSGPYGLQLTYNFIAEGGGGWGVHWVVPPMTHFNATVFTTLAFWVKGTSGGETFRIGLKDTGRVDVRGDEKEVALDSIRYVLVSASEWRSVEIPLSQFADNNGSINIASIENMSFGFNQQNGSGSICIDNIAFK